MRTHGQRSLARFLNEQMSRHGLDIAGLAGHIGVTEPTARRLLEGRGQPREATLVKIAEAFHVPLAAVSELVQPPSLASFLMYHLDHTSELSSTRKLGDFIGVAQGTAYRLSRGLTVPTDETLRKVANAFELDITEVREMARRPVGDAETLTWPAEFNQLTLPEREALFNIGRRIIEAHGLGRVSRQGPSSSFTAAASRRTSPEVRVSVTASS